MSWVVDPEVLIIEVETRPFLYAKTLPEYSNKILKNNAWEDITKKLSEDWKTLNNDVKNSRCKDIQAKWKHLRDNFRREYQAQKDVTSGQGVKKRKKYRYYDELLFLVPHVKDAKTSGNYSSPKNVSEQNTESPSTFNTENSPAGPSTATCDVSETPKKKKKTTSSFESEILKAIKNDASETDEDKTFCLSLVQSLKKMDDDTKMLAKIEILHVLRTFTNRTHNTYSQPVSQPNQSPFNRTNIEPYFSHPSSNFSLQPTPITHTNSQPTSAQTRNVYQQHSQSETPFIYTQTPQQQYSQTMFTQASNIYQQQHLELQPTLSLHQPSSDPVQPSKIIKILENRQYRPANFGQSSRPQSAQSFFTTFNPNICPSPSDTDLSSSTTAQSPLIYNINSPEDSYLSPNDCSNL